jgi:putative ubiquitin-RnfH superfamily antitoxin RatB of RatAB toxin-antitoxin module
VQNTVTPPELALQHFHHRSRYEIARRLAGDPEEARRIIKEIAACRAEFIVTDE